MLASRRVGSAVVHDTDGAGIGIITERDILRSVAADEDPDVEKAGDHQTSEVVFASPTMTLTEAADAMKRGGFRHLIVLEGGDVTGVISVRDIVRGPGLPRTDHPARRGQLSLGFAIGAAISARLGAAAGRAPGAR